MSCLWSTVHIEVSTKAPAFPCTQGLEGRHTGLEFPGSGPSGAEGARLSVFLSCRGRLQGQHFWAFMTEVVLCLHLQFSGTGLPVAPGATICPTGHCRPLPPALCIPSISLAALLGQRARAHLAQRGAPQGSALGGQDGRCEGANPRFTRGHTFGHYPHLPLTLPIICTMFANNKFCENEGQRDFRHEALFCLRVFHSLDNKIILKISRYQ